MNCYQIMAVRILDRGKSAVEVQRVLTEHGCSILTRLGLHDQSTPGTCSPSGLPRPPALLRRGDLRRA